MTKYFKDNMNEGEIFADVDVEVAIPSHILEQGLSVMLAAS